LWSSLSNFSNGLTIIVNSNGFFNMSATTVLKNTNGISMKLFISVKVHSMPSRWNSITFTWPPQSRLQKSRRYTKLSTVFKHKSADIAAISRSIFIRSSLIFAASVLASIWSCKDVGQNSAQRRPKDAQHLRTTYERLKLGHWLRIYWKYTKRSQNKRRVPKGEISVFHSVKSLRINLESKDFPQVIKPFDGNNCAI